MSQSVGAKYNARWTGTGLRVTNPKESVAFYEKHFGMICVGSVTFGDRHFFTLFRPEDELKDRSPEGIQQYMATHKVNFLSLIYDPEIPPGEKVNNGNEEPHRGFGHIAFNFNDVREAWKKLESAGVHFRKRPDDGIMKTIAFATDPDGYWIEFCSRGDRTRSDFCNLSQTMMRVKDPKKSIAFYEEVCGMRLVHSMRRSDFANHFLSSDFKGKIDPEDPQGWQQLKGEWNPVLELCHNYGTEKDPNFKYHTGNTAPLGFCGIELTVDDVDAFLHDVGPVINNFGGAIAPTRSDGLRGLLDCDGYFILLTGRNE